MTKQPKPERPPYGQGRDALILAAIEVVAARGLRGLTIRAVAEQAGVSHGLVRWHFGSRDGLLEASLIRSVELAIDTTTLEPRTGAINDLAADLPAWLEAQTALAVFQWECLVEARRKPELLPYVRQSYQGYTDAVRRELARAGLGNDGDLARAVFAMLDGLTLQQAVFGNRQQTERALEVLREMITALRGQRTRDSPAAAHPERATGVRRDLAAGHD